MKTNEIKTKRALKQVALNIVTKVREAMSWNEDVIIDVRNKDNYIEIETSQNCAFMTSTFLSCMVEVASEYKAKYPVNVYYGIETSEYYSDNLHEFIPKPLFNIQIGMNK